MAQTLVTNNLVIWERKSLSHFSVKKSHLQMVSVILCSPSEIFSPRRQTLIDGGRTFSIVESIRPMMHQTPEMREHQ